MCETEQPPLDRGLFQSPEHESPEMLDVLGLTEDGFDFGHWIQYHGDRYWRQNLINIFLVFALFGRRARKPAE